MIRLGVIGTGWIVESFLKAARRVEGISPQAVFSRDHGRGEAFAIKNDLPHVFTDLEEMAHSDLIDAVYIASPNVCHAPQSRLFLKNNKHVICEKPIAENGSIFRDLCELAKENKLVYMEALMALHLPQLKLIQDILPSLGRISMAKFDFCQLSSKYQALQHGELPNIFNPDMHTGSLMDIGIYCLYPALVLFGEYWSMTASAVKHENGIDLCGNVVLQYLDKQVIITHSKIGEGRGTCEIIGDNGTLVIRRISQLAEITLVHKDGTCEVIHESAEDFLPMQSEAQSFYDFIVSPEKNHDTMRWLEEICTQAGNSLAEIRQKCEMPF